MKIQCERCGEIFESITENEYEMETMICAECCIDLHLKAMNEEYDYYIRLDGEL